MQVFEMKIHIYAENEQEVNACKKEIYNFIEDNRKEGRVVTAGKLAQALSRWKQNALVKMGIINFLNK